MMNHDFCRGNVLSKPVGRLMLIVAVLVPLWGCAPDIAEDYDSPAAGMAQLGAQMKARGDYVAANDFYQRALQRDPKDVVALKGMAYTQEQLGNPEGAVVTYYDAIKLKPKDAELRKGLGKVLIALDRPGEARDQFKAALDIDDEDPKAINGLGIALDYLGEHKEAQKQYEAVLKREPDNLSTLNNMAYSYILTKNYDRAIKLLEPEQRNPRATPALRQNLALAYGMAGMDLDAERVAKMDLPSNKVKENLAYYRHQRAEQAVSSTPYAEIGTYATEAMAAAQIEKVEPTLNKAGPGLKPVILPQVAAPGGTPRFTVRMMGCGKPDELKFFCDQLAKKGIPCVMNNIK